MKLKLKATGEIADFNDEYAARLIEQGKAVLAPNEKKAEPEAPKEAEPPRKKKG